MRIVFFGAGAFGLPTLERLASEHDVVGVVTQPDRPAGRKRRLTPTPIGEWASAHFVDTPLFKPENVNDADIRDAVRAIDCDAWVVIAFGQKLGEPLLENRFAINLHASLLPRWRGAAPINHAIMAGDRVTGNSVITLADRMDAGLVMGQSERTIDPSFTAGELHDLLAADGPDLMLRVLAEKQSDALQPETQDESLVTIAGKLSRADGWVDFGASAEHCRRRIHGLTPWPGVTIRIGDDQLKVARVEALESGSEEEAGVLIDAASGVIACGEGTSLRLIEVQPAGKRIMAWPDYVRGNPIDDGAAVDGGAPC